MAEINFLADDGKKIKKKKDDSDKAADFAWTSPETDKSAGAKISLYTHGGSAQAGALKPANKDEINKNRSGISAGSGKSEKAVSDHARGGAVEGWKKGISGFIKSLAKPEEKPAVKSPDILGLKENKEIMAEAGQVYNEEKNQRRPAGDNPEKSALSRFSAKNWAKPLKKSKAAEADQWQAPEIIKTNLIQGEVTTYFDWKSNLRSVIASLLFCGIGVGLVFGVLILWEIKAIEKSESITVDIENTKQLITQQESKVEEINLFQRKLAAVNSVLSKHIYWNNFFKFFEDNTLPNIFYQGGFSGDISGKYGFSAVTDSFSAITDQLTVLGKNDKVKAVKVESGEIGEAESAMNSSGNAISFKIDLTLDPGVFYR